VDLRIPRIANLHITSTDHRSTIELSMTRFRPCIDLHAGSVKQIVGGTLSTTLPDSLKTNWTSEHPSAYYADLYKQHGLIGAHVIMLGPGNDEAAKEALGAWHNGMQVGGGITEKNAAEWIAKGAERVSLRSRSGHGNVG
jgi:phosphoribosylformimino-5-aminoimidazole carboxamide ribotide isomerase